MESGICIGSCLPPFFWNTGVFFLLRRAIERRRKTPEEATSRIGKILTLKITHPSKPHNSVN